MEDRVDEQLLAELLRRIGALEENVAFLEVWCEEHQDALDRVGETVFYVDQPLDGATGPGHLRVVDLRDVEEFDESGPIEESDYERRVRRLRSRIRRARNGLPAGSTDQRDASRS
jgi:hypothetical protein